MTEELKKGTTKVVSLQRKDGKEGYWEWVEENKAYVFRPLDWSTEEVVYVGRACGRGGWNLPETPFSNRVKNYNDLTPTQRLDAYKKLLSSRNVSITDLLALKGKKLACWCVKKKKDSANCHAFLLKKLVE